jgi:CSLREA domain-containing protein
MTGPGTIQGNIVGLNASGTAALGNQSGIGAGKGVLVGGTTPGAGNIAAGNAFVGISVGQQDAVIQGNFVGTNAAGTLDLGVQAIGIEVTGNYSTIGGTASGASNLVAHNAGTGILVNSNGMNADFFIHNPIQGNRIYANDAPGDPSHGLGIDVSPGFEVFGVTPNDVGDNDFGGNTLQNYPQLIAAGTHAQVVNITGTFNSTPNKLYRLDFYSNDACDPSGFGEGQNYLGAANAGTGADGNTFFSAVLHVNLPPGKWITATATSPTNDTSEFSGCIQVVGIQLGETLTVNSADDVNDGTCDGVHCSLREAIIRADAFGDTNPIAFDIGGGGLQTIQPATPLPPIFGSLSLDGTTQPGFSDVPLIILSGASMTGATADRIGLRIVGSPDTPDGTIRGLVMNGFAGGAISINGNGGYHIEGNYIGTNAAGTGAVGNAFGIKLNQSNGNVIGGTSADKRNIISGNTGDGVIIQGIGYQSNTTISGNYIGTDASGMTALPNTGYAIRLDGAAFNLIGGVGEPTRNIILGGILVLNGAQNQIQGTYIGINATGSAALQAGSKGITIQTSVSNRIGGTEPGAGNVISGTQEGITITGSTSTGTQVQGNYIGTNAAGTAAIPNTTNGIQVTGNASNTQIGGAEAGARNVISGNRLAGARVNFGTTGTIIQNNFIGTDVSGASPIPYLFSGISLAFNSRATIGGIALGQGNRIAFNSVGGIRLDDYIGAAITGNSIFGNDLLGIDLGSDGVTPNNPGNFFQNAPALTDVTTANNSLHVVGTLSSLPSKTYRVEFFANDSCDVSGFGEGQVFLGAQSVSTNAAGNATFNVQLPLSVALGQFVTTTATSPTGSTSEFSACSPVLSGAAVAPVRNYFTSRDITLTWSPVSWSQGYHVQVSADPVFPPAFLIVDNPGVTDTSLDITVPADGVYYWRVQAKKPDGTWGNWGTVDAFTVQES